MYKLGKLSRRGKCPRVICPEEIPDPRTGTEPPEQPQPTTNPNSGNKVYCDSGDVVSGGGGGIVWAFDLTT